MFIPQDIIDAINANIAAEVAQARPLNMDELSAAWKAANPDLAHLLDLDDEYDDLDM